MRLSSDTLTELSEWNEVDDAVGDDDWRRSMSTERNVVSQIVVTRLEHRSIMPCRLADHGDYNMYPAFETPLSGNTDKYSDDNWRDRARLFTFAHVCSMHSFGTEKLDSLRRIIVEMSNIVKASMMHVISGLMLHGSLMLTYYFSSMLSSRDRYNISRIDHSWCIYLRACVSIFPV